MTLPLALLFALAVAVTPPPEAPALRPLEVHFIDVGQGDGMLIRSPAGKTVLIDAGNVGAGGAVNDYLGKLGVEGLDLVIVSHPHMDHMGGMLEVLEKHPPKAYLDPGYVHPIANYDALLDWLEAKSVPVMVGRAGRTITLEPGITLELLAPESPLLFGTRSDANSNSVVAKLVYGKVSFLFTGDSEDETEKRVMRYTNSLEATVLKVAHHGGRHSTSDVWLSRVLPTYAVISAGALNRYKHPTKETLGRLSSRGIQVFRTDTQGDIIARTDGQKIQWNTTGDQSARLDEKGGRSSYQQAKPESAASTAAAQPDAKALVDVNTADEAALKTLPGIGPATAQAIIKDREQRGPYADLPALMRIRGIGQKKIDNIAEFAEARPPAKPVKRPQPEISPAPVTPATNERSDAPSLQGHLKDVSRAIGATARSALPVVQRRNLLSRTGDAHSKRAEAERTAHTAHIVLDLARRVVDSGLETDSCGDTTKEPTPAQLQVPLNLNTATKEELIALGLDAEEASAVVEYRDTNGAYESLDELESVEIIPSQTRLHVLPFLTVRSE